MSIKQKSINEYTRWLNIAINNGISLDGSQSYEQIIRKLNKLKSRTGEQYSTESIKNFFKSFQYYLNNQDELNDNQIILKDKITNKINNISVKVSKQISKHELSENQKKNYIPWNVVVKVYNKVKSNKDISQHTHKEYVLLSLYVKLGGVRRIEDFTQLYIYNGDSSDINKNYYLMDKSQFIFNNFKTNFTYDKETNEKKHKAQTVKISKLLNDIIKEYINKYNINDMLLELTDNQIKSYIRNIFKRYIDNKDIGIDILRHSFITWFLSKNPTSDQKKRVAYIMGHNIDMQENYMKIEPEESIKIKYNRKSTVKKGPKVKYDNDEERKQAKLESQRKWREEHKEKVKENNKKYYMKQFEL